MDENVERKLLDAIEGKKDIEACLLEEKEWPILYHLSPIRENILEWYHFNPQASLLEIGAECGALTDLFCRKVERVVAVDSSEHHSAINSARNKKYTNLTVLTGDFCNMEIKEKFDYVTLIGSLGYAGFYSDSADPYMDILIKAKECLKPGGRLILAIENKYGLKYFAGVAEEHTGRCFDGIENYVVTSQAKTFSHKALDKMLLEAGFLHHKFYYPMPDYKLSSEIYSEQCLPSFGSIRYASVAYDRDRYELLDERLAFDSICQDEMFGDFANSFLVISDVEGEAAKEESTVIYAKYNRQRAPEFQISTKIIAGEDGSRYVEKEALRSEAKEHMERLSENRKKLLHANDLAKAAGGAGNMPCPVEILHSENGRVTFPYIQGTSLSKEVNQSLGRWEVFTAAVHEAIDSIYGVFLKTPGNLVDFTFTKEFEEIFGAYEDVQHAAFLRSMKSLRVSNVDSILSNFVRLQDGSLAALDYEWVFDFPIPVEYLIYRTAHYYYSENVHYIRIGEQELWKDFGWSEEKVAIFSQMDDHFQQYVHGKNRKYIYTSNYAKKTINLGLNIKNGENWFLSIADDIQYLNSFLGTHRRDLVRCRVKVHRKNEFVDKCERKVINILQKMVRK